MKICLLICLAVVGSNGFRMYGYRNGNGTGYSNGTGYRAGAESPKEVLRDKKSSHFLPKKLNW